jgi:hypothetical protein
MWGYYQRALRPHDRSENVHDGVWLILISRAAGLDDSGMRRQALEKAQACCLLRLLRARWISSRAKKIKMGLTVQGYSRQT